MRLIDADALKEMLIKERDAIPLTKTERYGFGVELPDPHGMSMRGGINKAFRCMEQTPTIDAVPVVRWIPVTEQLPAAGRHVLIYRANGRVSIGHMLLLEAGLDMNNWYKDGVAKFHDVTSYRLVGVTHWMPLPEPPKEVE